MPAKGANVLAGLVTLWVLFLLSLGAKVFYPPIRDLLTTPVLQWSFTALLLVTVAYVVATLLLTGNQSSRF